MTTPGLTRRALITSAAAGAALVLLPVPLARAATDAEVAAALEAVLAGRSPLEAGLEIEVPALAENGGQVPVTIRADSPMTAADHVTAIHLIATQNPTPGIGTFRLSPRLARADVFTRIRLAEGQRLWVLAELSNGTVLSAAAEVAVTTGGCAT
jgi:sulfur-oxidizing protein SoxY